MERKIATQLTDKVKSLVALKLNSPYYFGNDDECIFHYPNFYNYNGFLKGYHIDLLLKDYELVSEQEFLDYFKEDESIPKRMIDDIKKGMLYPNEFYKPKIKFKKPIHYSQTKSGMDVFDVANDWNIKEPELFSALKYILRCGKKDEASKEIEKAIDCLQRYKKRI